MLGQGVSMDMELTIRRLWVKPSPRGRKRQTGLQPPSYAMADDVSGNRSKQYNPHVNIYMKNLNVPSEKLKQQFFVRFCSTSPDASSNEQFRAFLENW